MRFPRGAEGRDRPLSGSDVDVLAGFDGLFGASEALGELLEMRVDLAIAAMLG